MPAIAAITIGDGSTADAGYPAAGKVVFEPTFMDATGVMTWYSDESVMDAREKITLSVRQPAKGSQVARVIVKVATPVMDDDDSSLKVGEILATCEFVIPKRTTEAQRTRFVAVVRNLLTGGGFTPSHPIEQGDQNDFVGFGVVNLQSPY